MIGTKLAHYEITGHLGSGGMGEVYQASDPKLHRSVAIKLLPEAFAREARVLASLNHPNIAGIHGLETGVEGVSPTGDVRAPVSFLVMEFVPGETLAERVARGPVPVAEALTIARQIAEALEAAHEKGIIHRDLKPANIKVKGAWGPGLRQGVGQPSDITDGTVKVLDFGLAKAYETDASAVNLSNSPTMTAHLAATEVGMILGTAAYMSPEQARGRPVDKRTDIFAFGCVLYEMLTGHPAFEGEDVTEILSAVLKTDPDWTRLPQDVPPAARRLLRLCLEKNAKNRRSDATDVRLDIDAALKEPEASGVAAIAGPRPARQTRGAWIVATLATLVALGLLIPVVRSLLAPRPAEMRLDVTTPATDAPLEFALSPDGQRIAFIASDNGARRLWVRELALDNTGPRSLPGTEDAAWPFWSPNNRSIGFFAAGKLFRIDISGGLPRPLANANGGRGGTWNMSGTILFSAGPSKPLMTVAESGGAPVSLAKVGGSSAFNYFPRFLPDGRRFVFLATTPSEAPKLYLGSLDGREPKPLGDSDSSAEYLVPGFLVFRRRTTLLAQHLDASHGELTGEPMTLADSVGCGAGYQTGVTGFSVSDNGRVAYRSGCGMRQLMWMDHTTGAPVALVGAPDAYGPSYPELSGDGRQIALVRTVQRNQDVWLVDAQGGLKQFTSDAASDTAPLWSFDGRIGFASNRKGAQNLYYATLSGGAGGAVPLYETPNNKFPRDWSHVDGRYLLYSETNPKTGEDLWALPLTGAHPEPFPVANTPVDESNGQFSPDDRWVAYEINVSGRSEIVVQSFPQSNGHWQISTNGGTQPRWRFDSKELYFIAADGNLMATKITVSGAELSHETPIVLFPAHVAPGFGLNKQQYAVARDGGFLIVRPVESEAAPITLLLNWRPK